MFSDQLKREMGNRFSADVSEDVQLLWALLRGTLPASDLVSVPEAVLEGYVRHGLFLRAHSTYCQAVPEDIFLHYVFYPRVNSEDLVDCRRFFYEKLAPVVDGLSGVEAALAVNRWCAAQMTYESTDGRTVNPLTAYSCGLGRCGEESVFAVTALRAVGIPARQVYVPWWSHCDDNHAWVEVYVEGTWHFLGACEPEPVLDRGWFSSASTRAMMAVSRSFFDYGLEAEQIVNREGCCIHHNQLPRYADTTQVTVAVLAEGKPVAGAQVTFGVLNMADFAVIARLETDAKGQVCLETGLGSLLLEARKDGSFAFGQLHACSSREYTLHLQPGTPAQGSWDLDFCAPAAGTKNRTALSPAQQAEKMAVLAQAREMRENRIKACFLPEYAAAPEEMQKLLRLAGGNAGRLWDFYNRYGAKALAILQKLAPKDYRDADPAVLETFLEMATSPRIGLELLSPWRQAVLAALSPAQQACFRETPEKLWDWIREQFPERGHRFYDALWLQPDGALRLGAADEKGRRLLYAAICRSLDIPETAPWQTGPLLELEIAGELPYFQGWTLARWEDGWQTLELAGDSPVYRLPEGQYRLITANRLPNGNQLANIQVFRLDKAQTQALKLRQGSLAQMLAHYPVPLEPCALELRLYLEVGAEPTEHALNELLEAKEPGLPVRLLVPKASDGENPTLQKVLKTVPGVTLEVAELDDGKVEALARAMYLEPGVWPLLVLTDGVTGYYGHCGYGVNTVPLALGLAKGAADGVSIH